MYLGNGSFLFHDVYKIAEQSPDVEILRYAQWDKTDLQLLAEGFWVFWGRNAMTPSLVNIKHNLRGNLNKIKKKSQIVEQ